MERINYIFSRINIKPAKNKINLLKKRLEWKNKKIQGHINIVYFFV